MGLRRATHIQAVETCITENKSSSKIVLYKLYLYFNKLLILLPPKIIDFPCTFKVNINLFSKYVICKKKSEY